MVFEKIEEWLKYFVRIVSNCLKLHSHRTQNKAYFMQKP
ncbi:hypothetical protein HJ01_00087 [Flavobacterium frigoris PS1]|uniref:Uncharacterized protein n=1 Tax=Flavobacterium frigoris (strain PS1) TaxID=1086011 RepID=H7FLN9_FLAFP|nr:hypothetical protein HJ01_00087 [Flavobacterium frigoris PS1]